MLISNPSSGCAITEAAPPNTLIKHIRTFVAGIIPQPCGKHFSVQDDGTTPVERSEEPSVTTDNSLLLPMEELAGKSIFMDFTQEDEQAARQLKQLLEQHDLNVSSLSREKPFDPTERFKKLEESLKSCDVVFLFYVNNIPASWVGTRLKHYQVIQVKRSKDNPMKIIVIGSETHPYPPADMTLPKNTKWLKFNLSIEGSNK